MNTLVQILVFAAFLLPTAVHSQDVPIDFDKARAIFERRKAGESVTPDEEAYVKRAMAEHQKRHSSGVEPEIDPKLSEADQAKLRDIIKRHRAGEFVSPEEQSFAMKNMGRHSGGGKGDTPKPWTDHLIPLTELGEGKYKGEDGGLYGGGSNTPPATQLAAAMKAASETQPLDAEGKPSPEGKIGLLSVGMSNTTMEYSKFKQLADADSTKSSQVIIIDGAQGGQTAMRWADPKAKLWSVVDDRMKSAGLIDKQIQVAWMKQAEAGPAQYGAFPKHAKQLQENLLIDLRNLKAKFPNLRLVYLSSRIYAGYATTGLNPEPYAYEEGFSMRWLIQDQIANKPETKGLPVLLWGPYLWADGETPRKADGLIYKRADLSDKDGTHPADSAREKVANLLLSFLKTDVTAKSWFTGKAQ